MACAIKGRVVEYLNVAVFGNHISQQASGGVLECGSVWQSRVTKGRVAEYLNVAVFGNHALDTVCGGFVAGLRPCMDHSWQLVTATGNGPGNGHGNRRLPMRWQSTHGLQACSYMQHSTYGPHAKKRDNSDFFFSLNPG